MNVFVKSIQCLAAVGFLSASSVSLAKDHAKLPSSVTPELQKKVIANYATLVHQAYSDLDESVKKLSESVIALVEAPSDKTLNAAKNAWVASRKIYGQTEPFRFYAGPIDDAKTGPESLMNAWPLDEAYIDYVKGNKSAGIINNPKEFPQISKNLLLSLNEKNGEKNISTGYHAIEFLLWGQDFNKSGPGNRPFADYVKGKGPNAERRATYLKLLVDILKDHTTVLVEAWKPNVENNYASAFLKENEAESIQKIMVGMVTLGIDELAGERMTVPLAGSDQENEQSCFSDTTSSDFLMNITAINNVYEGRYGNVKGEGIVEIIRALDPALEKTLTAQIAQSVKAIGSLPPAFDSVIVAKKNSAARRSAAQAVVALETQTKTFAKAGRLLGLTLNIQE